LAWAPIKSLIVEKPLRPQLTIFATAFSTPMGAEVEQCGNGARCFVRFVHEQGLTRQKDVLAV
jgi:diaminopimelate epimerase